MTPSLLVAAIHGFAVRHLALQAGAIVVSTFVLEDAATVLTAIAVQSGALSMPLGIGALYIGIVLGDLGLYGLGALAARTPLARRLVPPGRADGVGTWLAGKVFRVVLVSRFLPGVRLPTYTTCGYLRADLRCFALATMLATAVWTSGLFLLSWQIGDVLMVHFGIWRWAGAAGMAVFMITAGRLAEALGSPHSAASDPSVRSRR